MSGIKKNVIAAAVAALVIWGVDCFAVGVAKTWNPSRVTKPPESNPFHAATVPSGRRRTMTPSRRRTMTPMGTPEVKKRRMMRPLEMVTEGTVYKKARLASDLTENYKPEQQEILALRGQGDSFGARKLRIAPALKPDMEAGALVPAESQVHSVVKRWQRPEELTDRQKYSFKFLGLDPARAKSADVDRALRRLALRYHPDVVGGSHEQMVQLGAAIDMARSVLAAKGRPIAAAKSKQLRLTDKPVEKVVQVFSDVEGVERPTALGMEKSLVEQMHAGVPRRLGISPSPTKEVVSKASLPEPVITPVITEGMNIPLVPMIRSKKSKSPSIPDYDVPEGVPSRLFAEADTPEVAIPMVQDKRPVATRLVARQPHKFMKPKMIVKGQLRRPGAAKGEAIFIKKPVVGGQKIDAGTAKALSVGGLSIVGLAAAGLAVPQIIALLQDEGVNVDVEVVQEVLAEAAAGEAGEPAMVGAPSEEEPVEWTDDAVDFSAAW